MRETKEGREVDQAAWTAKAIGYFLDQGKSISLWRLPNSKEKNLLIAHSVSRIKSQDLILENAQHGYIISPFNRNKEKYFLSADYHFTISPDGVQKNQYTAKEPEDFPPTKRKPAFHTSPSWGAAGPEENAYQKLVGNCLEEINRGTLEKIVPSRRQTFPLPPDFDPLQAFEKLCDRYPNAFVSLHSTPDTGTWLGASPELLVHVDAQGIFKTTALASTQPYVNGTDLKNVSWNQKEIEEQALVCRYIINCFKKIRLREYEEHGPRTIKAGNLLHLKTDYTVDMQATNFPQLGTVMLQLLHPTSAVCGMPLEPAIQFLLDKEGYERELYTGFQGPVNIHGESHVYVTLRCMQIVADQACLYAGAGVTIDSNPQLEWDETVMKMNTLRQVILS